MHGYLSCIHQRMIATQVTKHGQLLPICFYSVTLVCSIAQVMFINKCVKNFENLNNAKLNLTLKILNLTSNQRSITHAAKIAESASFI